ncbi:hypothetical protein [Aerophototrophica crusticola]|uniref:hypothetical protein n=1 Tax=Aerophototrophica crusticola TaxID=1709002 RepID=UPI0038511141
MSVMAGWPGPALWLDAGGRVLQANTDAQGLAPGYDGWREELGRWVASGGPLVEATHSVLLEPQWEAPVVEFTAVPLADGGVLCLGRNVTLERRLRNVLAESRQRYKDLVEISSDFAWEVGPDGLFAFVSPAGPSAMRRRSWWAATPRPWSWRSSGMRPCPSTPPCPSSGRRSG